MLPRLCTTVQLKVLIFVSLAIQGMWVSYDMRRSLQKASGSEQYPTHPCRAKHKHLMILLVIFHANKQSDPPNLGGRALLLPLPIEGTGGVVSSSACEIAFFMYN